MKRKIVCLLMTLALMAAVFPAEAMAAVKTVKAPTETKTLVSSEHLEHNFVKVTAEGGSLHVECETPLEADRFGLSVRRVKPSSTKAEWKMWMYPEEKAGYYRFEGDLMADGLDGDYVLCITMYRNGKTTSEMFYKNANIRVKKGKITLLKYDTIVKANRSLAKKGAGYKKSLFTDKYLSDVKNLLFKDPKTGKVAAVTKSKVKYFKKVSDAITKGADSDYEKALKIYEYVAENFYYDDIAFSTKKNQYVDPYRNLYNLRNKKKSANSTSNGKVATVCVGNAGMVVALARAQGIPARIVNGHHVGMGIEKFNNWSTEQNVSKVDHWWAEVYVDGRWIVVDPTTGNSNKYNSKKGTWTYTGLTNYIFFDPTVEQLSTSHVTYNIRGKGL